jgi:hypothetical protein
MVLRELVLAARRRGIERLVGRYIPSGRNAMVADHYATLGFSRDGDAPDSKTWTLDVASPEPAPTMKVVRAPAFDGPFEAGSLAARPREAPPREDHVTAA